MRREIAQLVFLYLVIPPVTQRSDGETLLGQAQKIAEALTNDPQTTLRRIYDALNKRENVVKGIAKEVVNLLKNKRDSLVSAANCTASKLYISVSHSIVNWNSLEGMSASSSGDVLATAVQGRDEIAWLGHIQVGNTPAAYNVLALLEVRTELEEHVITSAGKPEDWPLHRKLDALPIPVRIAPHTWNAGGAWQEAVAQPGLLAAGYGVQIEYDPAHLVADKRMERAHAEQLRAAQLVASAVLMYVALFTLVNQVKAATGQRQLTMLLLRLQQTGKSSQPDEDNSGSDTAMYAISQALERVLSHELPVKLQGLVAGRIGGKTASEYQRIGTLNALHGSQTLSFAQQGSLDKVALITYVTRPCDTHPQSDRNSYLFISRTYFASSKDGQTTLRVGRMWSRVVEGEELEVQHLILEEIKRLQEQGYRHIMLLSHHFGSRRIGRAAERHAPHASLEFLNHAAQRFPKVLIYPLHRDVFPATRLRTRDKALESAFEVRDHYAHGTLYVGGMFAVLRSAEPVYTFATLHVIGEEERPQSGFCTYFFTHEGRLADAHRRDTIHANILGLDAGSEYMKVRQSLISVLRAIHFMESEKPFQGKRWLPVLDPFAWVNPTKMAALGELQVASGRRKGSIILSMPALLTQVCSMLYPSSPAEETHHV